jgi:hypothetical protein
MGWFNRNSSGQSNKDLPLWQIVLGGLLYIFVEPSRWLWKRAYGRGFGRWLMRLVGIAAAVFLAALPLGNVLHSFGFTWWSRTLLAGLGGLLFFGYAFPIIWEWVICKIGDLCSAIIERTRKIIQAYGPKVFGGLLTAISTVTFSKWLWKPVLEATRRPLVVGAIQLVAMLSTLAGSAYTAWLTYQFVNATLIHFVMWIGLGHALGFVLAVAAAVVVFAMLAGVVWQLLDYGKLPFIAEAVGAFAVWGAFGWISAFAGSLLWTVVYSLLAYVLVVGWVFPGAIRLFSNGFWSALFKKLEPLARKAYDEESAAYRYFFHHLMTAVCTALISWGAFALMSALAMSWFVTAPVVLVAAWCAYGLIFKATDHDGGNIMFALATALTAGYFTATTYAHFGFVFGIWGGIVVGVIAMLVLISPILPWLYLGLRWFLSLVGKTGLQAPASAWFNRLNARYLAAQKRMQKLVEQVYEKDEDDKPYRLQFLHVANVLVTVVVWLVAHIGMASIGASWLWSLVAQIVAPLVSYLFVGRVMLKHKHGAWLVSSIFGLLPAIFVGSTVLGFGSGLHFWVLAFISFAFTWASLVFVLFAPIYVGVQKLTESWTVGWLGPFLGWLYDLLWTPVGWFWEKIKAGFEWVRDWLKPVWARVSAFLARAKKAYEEFLNRIRGRR